MDTYHKIYADFKCIEDEFFNLIYIPLIDKYHNISGYAVSNLSLKDKLLKYSYHQVIETHKNKKRYARSNLGISMHEIVIGGKATKGYKIDHINSDGLFNTEENLRYATDRLNAQNRLKKTNTSSKYIGVYFDNGMLKWASSISDNYKRFYLGSFENETEAAKVYDMHAIYYYKNESPLTNNLLTKSEIENIKNNGIPEKYQRKTRDLPKYITKRYKSSYRFRIMYDGKEYCKSVKTLEEAIILKKEFLEKISKNKEITKYEKEIMRNTNGLAIIYMSNGKECLVDDDHWHDLMQYKWNCYINENGKIYGYPSSTVNGKTVKLHRYIYEKYIGQIPSDMTVDHIISSSILDVRIKNLRLANSSLQAHNKDMSKNRIDKYKGINPTTTGYNVIVNENYHGTFKTAEKAAEKANEIYTSIYGDQATLNVIDFSKKTTIYDRIPEENITKEYIMGLTKVCDVKNIVIKKGLNPGKNGVRLNADKIILSDIKLKTLDKYKQIIIDKLYPETDVLY